MDSPRTRYEDMDDDDDEIGHLYTGLCDTRVLACIMLEDWEPNLLWKTMTLVRPS